MKWKILVAALLGIAGCYSLPATYQFQNSAVVDRSFDDVWASISEFFTSNNIQIKTIEKDSGLVYAERQYLGSPAVQGRIGDIGDCGTPGASIVQSQSIQMNVFAKRVASGTQVTVNTSMSDFRCFSSICNVHACNSTGALEQRLLAYVGVK